MRLIILGNVISTNELKKILERKNGKTVVFTNGCFDLLHRGHIELLEDANKLGDILVIGLNSDKSVRRLKGSGRPVQNQADRAYILASLIMVDYVVIFEEDTPEKLISLLHPDIQVKGGDWDSEDIPEAKILSEYGGKLVIVPFRSGYSSSTIINRIKSNQGKNG